MSLLDAPSSTPTYDQSLIKSYQQFDPDPEETVGSKLLREVQVVNRGVGRAALETLTDPMSKAPELVGSGVFGAGVRTLSRMGAPGRVIATTIGATALAKMGYDELTGDRWSTFGNALSDAWKSEGNREQAIEATKSSLGNFMVDTLVGMVAHEGIGFVPKPKAPDRALALFKSNSEEAASTATRFLFLKKPDSSRPVLDAATTPEVVPAQKKLDVVPVTKSNVDEAAAVANDGFAYGKGILDPEADFRASLDPKRYQQMYGGDPNAPTNLRYFASRGPDGKINGTTGLYEYPGDPQSTWMGWFTVSPDARGQGVGSQLLQFTIDEARKTGRPYLKLYTSDHPAEAVAQHLYKKAGLNISGVEPPNEMGVKIIYRTMKLSEQPKPAS